MAAPDAAWQAYCGLDTDTPNLWLGYPDSATARYLRFLADHTGYSLGRVDTPATRRADPHSTPESNQAQAPAYEPRFPAGEPDSAATTSNGDLLAGASLGEPPDEARPLAGNSATAAR